MNIANNALITKNVKSKNSFGVALFGKKKWAKIYKNLKKMLDKATKRCYNKDTKKGDETYERPTKITQ